MAVSPRASKANQPVLSSDAEERRRSQELGVLGKFFGGRDQAPINIAAAIVVLGIFGVLVLPFVPTSTDFSKADMAKSLGSLILAALTFLGGYLGAGRRPPQ